MWEIVFALQTVSLVCSILGFLVSNAKIPPTEHITFDPEPNIMKMHKSHSIVRILFSKIKKRIQFDQSSSGHSHCSIVNLQGPWNRVHHCCPHASAILHANAIQSTLRLSTMHFAKRSDYDGQYGHLSAQSKTLFPYFYHIEIVLNRAVVCMCVCVWVWVSFEFAKTHFENSINRIYYYHIRVISFLGPGLHFHVKCKFSTCCASLRETV